MKGADHLEKVSIALKKAAGTSAGEDPKGGLGLAGKLSEGDAAMSAQAQTLANDSAPFRQQIQTGAYREFAAQGMRQVRVQAKGQKALGLTSGSSDCERTLDAIESATDGGNTGGVKA